MILAHRILRLKIVLILIYVLFGSGFSKVQGQTCGVDAGIHFEGFNMSSHLITADTSSLQPGWSCYQFEWEVNNDPMSTDDTLLMFLPFGYNQICLTVYAVNSTTGDSCISEHCNIFYSSGNCVYPTLDIVVNGLTVDFGIGYYNHSAP